MNMIVHRVSPQQARYTPAGGREKCSFCRFYIAPKWCGHVTGPVSPMGWCKYFSQEMRARFGGSQVVAIGPPGASLDLGFMTPGTLDSRIAFTRASTATYTDASGVIQPAAIDQPRWDYAGGVLRGLLIEEARTNLLLRSTDLSNAVWSTGGSVSAAPTVTGNQVVSPDGQVTAARVVFPLVSAASSVSSMFQQITGTAAAYTFSVWLRGSVGGEQTYLYLTDGGTGYLGVTRVTLTTSWQRFSTTATLSAIAWVAAIGTDLRNGAQTSTPAQTIYAWGGQIESGTFGPTSFIPTTAATVTRARDSCLISPANMAPWFVSPGGSWMAEFIENSPASTSRVIAVGGGGGSQTPAYTSTVFNQFDGVTPIGTVNLLTLGVVQKGASAYAPSTGKVVLNGGAVVSAAMTTGYAALATNGVVFFADQAGAFAITGYLRRVQYWPRVLSDAEMQQVTT